MSKPARDSNIDEALDWLLRLQAFPADENLRAEAEAWRTLTPQHARAWKRAERAWEYAAGNRAECAEAPPLASEIASARISLGFRGRVAASLLGLGLVVLAGVVFWGTRADYQTATAELRAVTLEDGTRIDLAATSAMDVAFAQSRRSVTLWNGEAFFAVTRDAGRPFVVKAGDLSINVIGTAFNVRLSPDLATVTVTEGIVEARYAGQQVGTVMLTAGDQVEISRSSGSIRQTKVAAEDVAPWRTGQLVVHGVPLSEVVADIRRYSGKWIVIEDARLGSQQVTGVYDLREPDKALRVLVGPFGGTVREITPFLRLLSGP